MAQVWLVDDCAWDPKTEVDGTRVLCRPLHGGLGGSPGRAPSRMALLAWQGDGLRGAENRAEHWISPSTSSGLCPKSPSLTRAIWEPLFT